MCAHSRGGGTYTLHHSEDKNHHPHNGGRLERRQASSRFLRPDDTFNKCTVPFFPLFTNRSLVLIQSQEAKMIRIKGVLVLPNLLFFLFTLAFLMIHVSFTSYLILENTMKWNLHPKKPNMKCYETNLTLSEKKPSVLNYNTNYKYDILELWNLPKIARILWVILNPRRRDSWGGETTCSIDEKFWLKTEVKGPRGRIGGDRGTCVAISTTI